MKKLKLIGLFIILLAFSNCVKQEYDTPPIQTIPTGDILSIKDLYQINTDSIVSGVYPASYKFVKDLSVYAVVGMDDKTGNIYKSAYIQDDTLGINLHLMSSGGLRQGDSIRINLNGLVLGVYKGMLQLDSVDADKNIVIQENLLNVTPLTTTISQLNDSINRDYYKSRLIKLENVHFSNPNQTWADAVNLESKDVDLVDDLGNTIIIRSSGYASFAGDSLPKGDGSLYAIFTVYGTTPQLVIRTPNEADFINTDIPGSYYLKKNFEDGSLTSGDWQNIVVSGSNANWKFFQDASMSFARITNEYNYTHYDAETWFVSPSFSLDTATTPILTFKNASDGNGADIEILISTDYDGTSDPTTATWTNLTATLSAGSLAWTLSGDIDLSAYKQQNNVYIGFKYTGTSTDGKMWQVDDILIKEQ